MAKPGGNVIEAAQMGASTTDILGVIGLLLVAFAIYRMRTQSSEIPLPRHERNYFVDSNAGKYRLIAIVSVLLLALGFYYDNQSGDGGSGVTEQSSEASSPVVSDFEPSREEPSNAGSVTQVDPAQDLLAKARDKLARADSEQALGNPRKAREAYVEARILYSQQGNLRGEAASLFKLGELEQREGQLPQARDALRLAMELYRKAQDKKSEAHILKNLAEVDRGLGNEEDARSGFIQAMGLYRELGDPLGEAHALSGLGDIERSEGNVADAQTSYEEALRLYRQSNDRLGMAHVQRGMGEVQLQRGRALDARKSFNAALEIYRAENNTMGEAHALRGQGDAERMLGNFEESRKAYNEARTTYERLGDSIGEANVLSGIGALEHTFGHSLDARDAFQKALTIYQRDKVRIGEANVHSQIGDVEKALGNVTDAREAYLRARMIYQEESVPGGEAAIDKSLAELDRAAGQNPGGDRLSASLSSAGSEPGNPGDIAEWSGMPEEGDAADDPKSSYPPSRKQHLSASPSRTKFTKVARSEPPPPLRRTLAAQGKSSGEGRRPKSLDPNKASRAASAKPVRAAGKSDKATRKPAPQRKPPKKPVPGLPVSVGQNTSRNRRNTPAASLPPAVAKSRAPRANPPADRPTPLPRANVATAASRSDKDVARSPAISAKPRPLATASIKSAGKSPASKPRTSASETPAKARVAAVSKVAKPRSQTSAVNPLIAQDLKDLERAKKLFHEAQKIYENLTKKHMATLSKPQTKAAPRPARK
jgi:tetratricopeptide (TPR) repeat protein